jgi:predicted cupin superfamily sugar epimerase
MNAKELIEKLSLKKHPEGGYYKETYRSSESLLLSNDKNRNLCTAIFFLLENDDKSHFHRIQSDELWFFHQGQPLEIVSIQHNRIQPILLGNDLSQNELPQAIIPANTWFASKVQRGSGYSLVSCTVSPGFDFADFEMAKREDLMRQYPQLESWIVEFTK